MIKLFLCCVCLLVAFPSLVSAKIYKIIDERGKVTFTDTPPTREAEAYELKKGINIVPPQVYAMAGDIILPYQSLWGKSMFQGEINGVAAWFTFDETQDFIVVHPNLAKQAGLIESVPETMVDEKVYIKTDNGKDPSPKYVIKSLKINDLELSDLVAGQAKLKNQGPNLIVLGQTFLDHYTLQRDLTNEAFILTPKK